MVAVIATTMALIHFLLSIVSEAHSWIDCIDTKRSTVYDDSVLYIFGGASGDGKCQGYGEGFPGRGNGGIGMEYTHKMLRNEVEAGTPVCKTVVGEAYSDWRTRISLVPGQEAVFGYMPNGHICKDKKAIGTQYGLYWTGQVGTALTSTLDMKPEHLLNGHTSNFDDGNCGESVDYNGKPSGRAGDGKPCVGSFTIPAGTAPGIYKMVWYWTFWLDDEAAYVDQAQAKGYFGAAYSTCFEVEVLPGGDDATKTGAAPAGVLGGAATAAKAPGIPAGAAPDAKGPGVPAGAAPAAKGPGVPAGAAPAAIAPTKSLPSNPTAGDAVSKSTPAAGAALDFGAIAPKPGVSPSKYGSKDGSKDVATVHGALLNSSNGSNSSAASGSKPDDDDMDATQEDPPAPSPAVSGPSSTSDQSSKSTSSTVSSANYITTSEGWLLGVALLLGALV